MVPNARKAPTQPGLITRSAYSAGPSRRAAPERRTAPQGRPSGRSPGTAIGGYHACRPEPAGRPQNAERPARGTSPLRAFRGTIRGRPRFAVICHQAGSRAQEALRWLAERCGKDPSTMPGACAAKAQSPVQFGGLKREKARRGDTPAGLSGACRARARLDAAALRAHRKAPSASATPCPPAASRCSTLGEGGLNCRVRDGTG